MTSFTYFEFLAELMRHKDYQFPFQYVSSVIFLQGVLLLNACLTVRAREANSHRQRGWEKFTDAVVHWINKNLSGVVFLLWGKPAQEKGSI